MEPNLSKNRIIFIDLARFYAMAMVYFGHFIERIMLLKNPAAATQYKFIYSFHMMLFFVLAGYVAKEKDLELGLGKYLKYRFLSRLFPFIFFTLVFMIIPIFVTGDFFQLKLPSVKGHIGGLISTLFGLPMFCIPRGFSFSDLNKGHFTFVPYDAVVVLFSSYGHMLWFPLTAIAGIFMTFFLGKITPSNRIFLLLGQNTLILMCLNGIFYHYVNYRVANLVVQNLPGTFFPILGIGFLMTVVSLALCIPLVYLFNRYIPRLVGKPKINGPWLKNFI